MFFKKKGMALGKRAWHQKKGAWRSAMLKQAGGNTNYVSVDKLKLIIYFN